jgi:predicted amidohydrolase YtcJ
MECGLGLGPDDISIVKNAIDKNLLPIDLVVFAKESSTSDIINAAYGVERDYDSEGVGNAEKILEVRPDLNKRYVNRVRLGGIKFWLDGSIPTAWMTKPYSTPPAGQPVDYVAYRQIPDQILLDFFDKYWKSPMQINMHTNGDAAAEQALLAIEAAIKKHGRSDHRPVFVHASYMRADQIERMKAVGGIPSYLSAALPGAGDTVLKLWGPDRASHAMAANTMIEKGMRFTLSHDAPITPRPVILPLLDAAVNRTSASGVVIGPKERINPYQALLAVTNYAAYQIKEEGAKGTLEVGKLADFVILDKNPLKVDPTAIKNIGVVETIKEGKTIYRADGKVGHIEGITRTLFALSDHAAQNISFGPCPGCQMIAYKKRMVSSSARPKFECI